MPSNGIHEAAISVSSSLPLKNGETFTEFGNKYFDRRITKAVTSLLKFPNPTLIQSKMIPTALEGRDMLVRGRTGSGKTLGFAIPMVHRLLYKRETEGRVEALRGLVMVPTRELCHQVYTVFRTLLHYCNDILTLDHTLEAKHSFIVQNLPSILISTPTALLALLSNVNKHSSRQIVLRHCVEIMVVDEADLMFSHGFKEDMETIRRLLPTSTSQNYQVILCSATLSDDVHQLKSIMLHKPVIMRLEEDEEHSGQISEFYYRCKVEDKLLILYSLLKLNLVPMKCLIFTSSIDRCYELSVFLGRFSIPNTVLSPLLPYISRQNIIHSFNQNVFDILIVTEESMDTEKQDTINSKAASKEYNRETKPAIGEMPTDHFAAHRGLDLQGVGCVLNYDMPFSKKSYIHRIGRTARGGASGTALSLCTENPRELRLLSKLLSASESGSLGIDEEHEESMKAFNLNINDISCFRYRVNGVSSGLTKKLIAETKMQILQKEILHSKQLKSHFNENPIDEMALKKSMRHYKDKQAINNQLHYIPEYMEVAAAAVQKSAVQLAVEKYNNMKESGSSVSKRTKKYTNSKSHVSRNPLKTFESSKAKRRTKFTVANQLRKEPSSYEMVTPEELPALSGRKLWKLRHKKKINSKGRVEGNYLNRRNQKKYILKKKNL